MRCRATVGQRNDGERTESKNFSWTSSNLPLVADSRHTEVEAIDFA